MRHVAFILMCATWSLCGGTLWGALAWERKEVVICGGLADERLTVEFPFVNDSQQTVTITQTSTSCGCTVVTLDHSSIAPGERGKLTVEFEVGTRTGLQQKLIKVFTSDPDQPQVDLRLRVELPPGPVISPIIQFWRVGDPLTPKTTTVSLPPELPLVITGIVPRTEAYLVQSQISPDGRSATVTLTPRRAEKNHSVDVEIRAEGGDPHVKKVYHVYGSVSDNVPPAPAHSKPPAVDGGITSPSP